LISKIGICALLKHDYYVAIRRYKINKYRLVVVWTWRNKTNWISTDHEISSKILFKSKERGIRY